MEFYPFTTFTSPIIPWNADESTMATALAAMDPTVGTVLVTRSRHDISPSWSGAFTWTITFTSKPGDVEDFTPVMGAISLNGTASISDGGGPGAGNVTSGTAQHPLPGANGAETDGNKIDGFFSVAFRGVTSKNLSSEKP